MVTQCLVPQRCCRESSSNSHTVDSRVLMESKVICSWAAGKNCIHSAHSFSEYYSAQPKAILIALSTNEIGRSFPNTTTILFVLNQGIRLAYTSVLSPPVTIHMCQAASRGQRSIHENQRKGGIEFREKDIRTYTRAPAESVCRAGDAHRRGERWGMWWADHHIHWETKERGDMQPMDRRSISTPTKEPGRWSRLAALYAHCEGSKW